MITPIKVGLEHLENRIMSMGIISISYIVVARTYIRYSKNLSLKLQDIAQG